MTMTKCNALRLVLTWTSLCWALTLALDTTVSTEVTMLRTTAAATPTDPSGHSSLDVSAMKIDLESKTPTSVQVEWNPPKNTKTSCRLVVRKSSKKMSETKKMTLIYELSRIEKIVIIRGLRPNTFYEITLECYGRDQQTVGKRRFVKTLPEDEPSMSKSEGTVVPTDSWEPRIQPVKESTKKTPRNGTGGGIFVFGNSSNGGNETIWKYASKNQKSSSNENTKRLIWIIPTIAGSVAGLMIIVAATVACSRAMVKTKHGKFNVRHNESGKKLITKSDPDEFSESRDAKLKQCTSPEDQRGGHDQQVVASEMTSVNTLQIRQPSHLTADNRAAVSVISWGSEFDILDKPDSIYTNETIETRSPIPVIPEPSKQVPAVFFRQNSLSGPTSPVIGQPWQPFSSLRAGTMPRSDEPPMYADSNINIVVPTGRNTNQGVGIYTNVQAEESLYANTGPQAEDRPPAIPPRPR